MHNTYIADKYGATHQCTPCAVDAGDEDVSLPVCGYNSKFKII